MLHARPEQSPLNLHYVRFVRTRQQPATADSVRRSSPTRLRPIEASVIRKNLYSVTVYSSSTHPRSPDDGGTRYISRSCCLDPVVHDSTRLWHLIYDGARFLQHVVWNLLLPERKSHLRLLLHTSRGRATTYAPSFSTRSMTFSASPDFTSRRLNRSNFHPASVSALYFSMSFTNPDGRVWRPCV